MIIKKMDSKQEEMAELTALLKGKLIPYQRFLIERELKAIRSGASGEKDSAYYIDFYFGRMWGTLVLQIYITWAQRGIVGYAARWRCRSWGTRGAVARFLGMTTSWVNRMASLGEGAELYGREK
jgi:hypothetical protein